MPSRSEVKAIIPPPLPERGGNKVDVLVGSGVSVGRGKAVPVGIGETVSVGRMTVSVSRSVVCVAGIRVDVASTAVVTELGMSVWLA